MDLLTVVNSVPKKRENKLCLGIDPFWGPLAMVATQDLVLNNYFRNLIVIHEHNLPKVGPVLLAPTHRSRWDSLMLPMSAGRRVTGRDCRFMVTTTEMKGLQGWFLNRLGCFPVDQRRPSLITLRYAIDLLIDGQQLVVFPEGRINRSSKRIKLKQGLARLSQLALGKGVNVQIVPVGIAYSDPYPKLFGSAAICFEEPMTIVSSGKKTADLFNLQLSERMHAAEQASLFAVGRISKEH